MGKSSIGIFQIYKFNHKSSAMLLKLRLYLQTFWRVYVLFLTPILLLPILLSGIADDEAVRNGLNSNSSDTNLVDSGSTTRRSDYEAMVCAYVLLLMAIYW